MIEKSTEIDLPSEHPGALLSECHTPWHIHEPWYPRSICNPILLVGLLWLIYNQLVTWFIISIWWLIYWWYIYIYWYWYMIYLICYIHVESPISYIYILWTELSLFRICRLANCVRSLAYCFQRFNRALQRNALFSMLEWGLEPTWRWRTIPWNTTGGINTVSP